MQLLPSKFNMPANKEHVTINRVDIFK